MIESNKMVERKKSEQTTTTGEHILLIQIYISISKIGTIFSLCWVRVLVIQIHSISQDGVLENMWWTEHVVELPCSVNANEHAQQHTLHVSLRHAAKPVDEMRHTLRTLLRRILWQQDLYLILVRRTMLIAVLFFLQPSCSAQNASCLRSTRHKQATKTTVQRMQLPDMVLASTQQPKIKRKWFSVDSIWRGPFTMCN